MYRLKFNENPLDRFKDNKIEYMDLVSRELFSKHSDKIKERMAFRTLDSCFQQMKEMRQSVYVFSEEELKQLIKEKWV